MVDSCKHSQDVASDHLACAQPSTAPQLDNTDKQVVTQDEELRQREALNYYPCLLRASYLGLCCLLMLTALDGVQNIMSQIFWQRGYGSLGQYYLFAFYGGLGCGCIIAPKIMHRTRQRFMLVSGATMNTLLLAWVLLIDKQHSEQISAIWRTTVYVGTISISLAAGLAAALLWVSTGAYHQAVNIAVGRRKSGFVIGVYWSFVACAQLTGNFLMRQMLQISTEAFFTAVLAVSATSAVMFSFVVEMVPQSLTQAQHAPRLRQFFAFLQHKSTRPLIFFCCFGGILLAFFTGFLYRLVLHSIGDAYKGDERYANRLSSNIYTILGTTDFFTGFVIGRFARCFTPTQLATVHVSLGVATVLACIAQYLTRSHTLLYIVGTLWGILDCYFNCAAEFICTFYYKEKLEIFGVYRLTQGVVCAFVQLLAAHIQDPLTFMLIILLATLCCLFQTLRVRAPTQQELQEIESLSQTQNQIIINKVATPELEPDQVLAKQPKMQIFTEEPQSGV